MEEEFDILAPKVLAGEATSQEADRLDQILAENGQLKAEFTELRSTWGAVKELGPMAEALDAPVGEPPAERLQAWRTGLANKFTLTSGEQSKQANPKDQPMPQVVPDSGQNNGRVRRTSRLVRFALAAALMAAANVAILLKPSSGTLGYIVGTKTEIRRQGKTLAANSATSLRHGDEIQVSAGTSATIITPRGSLVIDGPQTIAAKTLFARRTGMRMDALPLQIALFKPAHELHSLVPTRRGGQSIAIYSPAGFTANLTPAIVWKADPGKSYDLSISDELAPTSTPLRGAGIVPPVAFTNAWPGRTLAKDGLYRIRVTETGNSFSASELVFRTLATAEASLAPSGPDNLVIAYNLLTSSPPRLGDALAGLLSLPPRIAESELALRLKLFAFAQLDYPDDFDATLRQLKAQK